MSGILTLSEAYDLIDTPSYVPVLLSEILSLFQKIRDAAHKNADQSTAELAQLEMDAFNFVAHDGNIMPFGEGTTGDGEEIQIPSFNRFNDEDFDYFIKRTGITGSPILKARYAHILWVSPKKHNKFSQISIDSYIDSIAIYEKNNAKGRELGHEIIEALKNAYAICYQCKRYRGEDIKTILIRLVTTYNWSDSWSFAIRAKLMNLAIRHKSEFSQEDFGVFTKICSKLGSRLIRENKEHGAIDVYKIGAILDGLRKKKGDRWLLKQAQAWEILMKNRPDGDLAKDSFGITALQLHRKLGNAKKVGELEEKVANYKSSIKLQRFEQEIDISELVKQFDVATDEISSHDPEFILKFFAVSSDLLPDPERVRSGAEDSNRNSVLLNVIPIAPIDKFGNTIAHYITEEEKEHYKIYEYYSQEIKIMHIRLLDMLVDKTIGSRKIDLDGLIKFFKQNTWFGKTLTERYVNGKEIRVCWLDQIIPGLRSYLLGVEKFKNGENPQDEFLLFIDSVTQKFEGMFRDVGKLFGLPVTRHTKDHVERDIARPKYINEMLSDPAFASQYPEETVMFFKWLFIDKLGLNLRNEVAHSLLSFDQYGYHTANLLFLALMRLAIHNTEERSSQ